MTQHSQRATRQLPFVLMSVLVLMWLLLAPTLSVGSIVLGAIVALALGWAGTSLRPLQPRLRRPYLAAGLLLVVLQDIVRSNIGVARIVLGLVRDREVRSGFVKIPLDLTDPHGLAVLAAIVTSTPGTVWVDLAAGDNTLTLHVLDLKDQADWIDWIKSRYERRLMRIFE
jgi:multicomponent K+:H+ antiporter subunit E